MSLLNPLDPKDPNDIIDYAVNWAKWLRPGDEIISSTWTVESGLNKIADPTTDVMDPFTPTIATVWVAGGTDGTDYAALNRITTTQGRQRDKTITIRVQEL